MLDFGLLPKVCEQDGEVGREHEVYFLQSAIQKSILNTNELGTDGTNGMTSPQSSLQKASMSVDESEDVFMTSQAPSKGQSRSQPFDNLPDLQVISNRTLRSASKRQEKTAKIEKSKIIVHGAQVRSIEEQLVNVEGHLQSCQSELKNTKDKLNASKKALEETKAVLAGKKKDLATSRREHQKSKGLRRSLKKANKDLEQDLKASREELSQCRDDLFSLQKVAQIPDTIITERFDYICQHIMNWIDTRMANFGKANPDVELDNMFVVGEDKEATRFMQLHPRAGEHLARWLVHRFLQDNIFPKKAYFWGLPAEAAHMLWKAEVQMAELDPPRDSVAIARWRSETLQALAKSAEYKEHCAQQSQELTNLMFKELVKALPALFTGPQAHATFNEQVMMPTVNLANLMGMSSTYGFTITESPLTRFKSATQDLLKVHRMVDSGSGRPITPDSSVVVDKDGTFGKLILCLEPGLYRQRKGKETLLQQETFLVELHQPLPKRIKTSAQEL